MLRFTTPTSSLFVDKPIHMINLPASSGVMGVLANHAPTLIQLSPGLVSVFAEEGAEAKKFFITGGIGVVKDDNTASVTVPEALPLEDIDVVAAKAALADQQAQAAAAADAKLKAEAQIGVEVYEAMIAAVEGK